MKIYNRKIFTLAVLLAGLYVNAWAQSIDVHTRDYRQTIDMIGGDMERSSKAIQSAQNKQEILEWSFEDINFNVCRVQYDKNQELVEGTKNMAFYDKQVATMQAIIQINPNIKFFATMRSDYDGFGDENNLPDWIINYNTKVMDREKYGIFLADYLEYMSQQGVPISILSTTKEWMWFVRAEKVEDILTSMYSELESRGIARPIICDQGFWSLSAGMTYLKDVESLGTKDLYHSFCSHNYANEEPSQWLAFIEKAAALGKPVYDDETSTGSGSPTSGVERAMYKQIGEYIKKSERYEAGLSGEVFFEIWSRGINTETRSIYFPSGGTGTRLRGYYMMKHFSNNILDSRYIPSTINSLSNVYTISFRKDDEVVLWVINKSTTEYPLVSITPDAYEINGAINVHYWTDYTPVEGSGTTLYANANVFETSIAGESMSCYIFNVKDEPDNLARNGSATQSSTESDALAALAIDGNTDGVFVNGSVTQTTAEESAWWQVDLGADETIGVINIFNRTDECCVDNLSDFTVSVIDSANNTTFSQTYTTAPNPSISVDNEGVIGKLVKIQLTGSNSLSLAEVQVFEGNIFEKLDQSINFPDIEPLKYSLDPYMPGATASSGLAVEYSSSNQDVAIVVNREITITGVGTSILTASRPESATYNAAPEVSQTLIVNKADQQISFPELPVKKLGDPSFIPEATASSGLKLTYNSSDTQVASFEDDRLKIVGVGTSTITVSQPGNDNYNAAADSSQLFMVEVPDENYDSLRLVLTPTQDAYIRGGTYAEENFGSEVELDIKETSNLEFHRKTYLQFDIYDIDTVAKAVLKLYATSAGASLIALYKTTDNWSEGSINYNNAPSTGSEIGRQSVTSTGKYYEWDVTNFISEEMVGDNFASFFLADLSSNKSNIRFSSKEAADNYPQLVIDKVSIPDAIAPGAKIPVSLFSGYPNPAHDFLNLTAVNNIEYVEAITILGQKILERSSIKQKQLNIQLGDFAKGLYLFNVRDQLGNKASLKVLVD